MNSPVVETIPLEALMSLSHITSSPLTLPKAPNCPNFLYPQPYGVLFSSKAT